MMRKLVERALVPLVAAAATVGVASPAFASQLCTNDPSNPLPTPVIITGSSAVGNFLKGIGAALASASPPVTIVYLSPGSCVGVNAVFAPATVGTGTATYWDSSATAHTCTLANEAADIGVSDVYYSSCTAPYIFTSLPAGVTETLGPNQVMNFVVPFASSQSVISAQAAYMVYGFGAMSGYAAGPWTDPTVIFQRGPSSGTQSMLAQAIKVPADKWMPLPPDGGLPNEVTGGSTGMLKAVVGAGMTNPNTAIGILASDVTDGTTASTVDGGAPTSNRTLVKILQYQHYDQQCAWLPDSSATAYDKRNVREGHYALWGPVHFFLPPSPKAAAQTVVGYFKNPETAKVNATQSLLDLEIAGHTVPQCAMKAQRSAEIGPMTPYAPANPCGCYLEESLAPGSSGCTKCTPGDGGTPCAVGTCSTFGYCEGT